MLNNPFFCRADALLRSEADALLGRIAASPYLHGLFADGKMMGVLVARASDGTQVVLHAFSGTARGLWHVEGFVPPIFEFSREQVDALSKEHSQQLQQWLFAQYRVRNGRGEVRSVLDIFSARGLVPPAGTGDCAAPKLLQYALSHNLEPLRIGEFWYGASPLHEVRRQGAFYPACTGKCGPLLGFMLQGLDVEPNPLESDAHWQIDEPLVLFEDASLIVADKPAGMLAVPGRGTGRICLQQWLEEHCGGPVLACHRLDMDTSGVMVFARDVTSQAALQRQFEGREVSKAYLARLCPCPPDGRAVCLHVGDNGKIVLPLAPDWDDRPRQKVDAEGGRPAATGYEVLRVLPDGCIDVRLIPYTGRTHQLRVHCAHPLGLGRPILGDRLYGGISDDCGSDRLMLHASMLSLRHPLTGERLSFSSDFRPSEEIS